MSKSLYMRIVLMFLVIVIFSMLITLLISYQLYLHNQVHHEKQQLIHQGKQVIQSYQSSANDFSAFMKGATTFSDYGIQIFHAQADQPIYTDGRTDPKAIAKIDPNMLRQILQGQIQVKLISDQMIVGLPFQMNKQPHALILAPTQFRLIGGFYQSLISILSILIVGSVCILVAARYVVKPIQKFTAATQQMAQGDFNVHLDLQRTDELGTLAQSFNHMAKQLSLLDKMRQNFVSNVSHEIQSPLTSISGFSKVLQHKKLDESEQHHYLQIIEKESQRLSRLAKNLLQLSSLQSTHHPFQPQIFSLDEQLRQVVIHNEPLWAAKHQSIQVDLTPITLEADQNQLEQVWVNLLTNSIKFTPDKGVITLSLTQKNDWVTVKVADEGIGIPASELSFIFQPFYQVDKSRNQTGSGLGLSITKQIIDIHHGKIQIESHKGTEVTVQLPQKQNS